MYFKCVTFSLKQIGNSIWKFNSKIALYSLKKFVYKYITSVDKQVYFQTPQHPRYFSEVPDLDLSQSL